MSLNNGVLYDLSDMQANACSKRNGCGGGWMHYVYKYASNKPLGESTEYPYCDACSDSKCSSYVGRSACYTGTLGCHDELVKTPRVLTPSYTFLRHYNEYGLENVADHAVAIAIAPGDQFFFYDKGLFTGSTSYDYNSIHSLHAVTLNGYGKTDDKKSKDFKCTGNDLYWVLRNSWDTTWGIDGWMMIKRTKGNYGYGPDDIPYIGHFYPVTAPAGH